MKYILPQEIQVWYVLPVIRKELSKALVESGMTQKQAAKTLSLTEGAVSQYLSSKRGSKIALTPEIITEVKKSADIISRDSKQIMKETIRLMNLNQVWDLVCTYHKEHDESVKGKCGICDEFRSQSGHFLPL